MLLSVFICLFLVCSLFAYLASAPRQTSLLFGVDSLFLALSLGLSITSFLGLSLLISNLFQLRLLLAGLAALSAFFLLLALLRHGGRLPSLVWHEPFSSTHFFLLLILLIAAYFRFPPANYVPGGQDQGVYVNAANHFARTGRVFLRDETIGLLDDNKPLQELYVTRNYRAINKNQFGKYRGSFIPGFYVGDFSQHQLVAQFYHLHPMWFAISHLLLGPEASTYPLSLFSWLCVLAVYLITERFTKRSSLALAAALLLALSPAHSYFAKFPVSEGTACFFFIAALYAILHSADKHGQDLLISALSFGCLFLTRITGFLFLPLILLYVALRFAQNLTNKQRLNLALYAFALTSFYVLSFFYGMVFSRPYSVAIYKSKLNIGMDILSQAPIYFAIFALLYGAILLLLSLFQRRSRIFLLPLARWRRYWPLCLLLAALLFIGYRGYLLAFSNHYITHRWFGSRWDIAGKGLEAVKHLNITVLAAFLSPIGMLFFLLGLYFLLSKSLIKREHMLFGVFAFLLFVVLTGKQLMSPYLYFYGRYLVSELLPLAIIISVYGAYELSLYFKQQHISVLIVLCYLFSFAYYSLPAAWAHTRQTEAFAFYSEMKKVADIVGPKAVLFIEKRKFPEVQIVTPFRFTYGLHTFSFRMTDFGDRSGFSNTADYFNKKGFRVFLMTSRKYWRSEVFLKPRLKLVVPIVNFVGTRGKILPNRFGHQRFGFYLYEYRAAN